MKRLFMIFLVALFAINSGFSQSKSIDAVLLKTADISEEYKALKRLKCQSMQAKLLYENPDVYSFVLGNTLEKRFQTFQFKGQKGSILYFEFDKEAYSGKAFVENLLWGGSEPTKAHPETIITKGHVMIILSFPYKSDIRKELTQLLSNK